MEDDVARSVSTTADALSRRGFLRSGSGVTSVVAAAAAGGSTPFLCQIP